MTGVSESSILTDPSFAAAPSDKKTGETLSDNKEGELVEKLEEEHSEPDEGPDEYTDEDSDEDPGDDQDEDLDGVLDVVSSMSDDNAIEKADKGPVTTAEVPSASAQPIHHQEKFTDAARWLPSPACVPPSKLLTNPEPRQHRAPSPSDAFLFKCRPRFDHLPDNARAQILGQKSGKLEYFAARERNRTINNLHALCTPVSAIRQTLVAHQARSNDAVVADPVPETPGISNNSSPRAQIDDPVFSSFVPQHQEVSIKLPPTDPTLFSAWTVSGERFINFPCPDDSRVSEDTEPHAPELDMSSAYKYQQSKLAAMNPRRVPIRDLLAQEPKERPKARQASPTAAKRSFQEAFSDACPPASVEETEDNAVSSPPGSTDISVEHQDANKVSETQASHVTTQKDIESTKAVGEKLNVPQPTPAPVHSESPRPLKKLKVATQVAACVALGSAVTFSFLVNTAPVF